MKRRACFIAGSALIASAISILGLFALRILGFEPFDLVIASLVLAAGTAAAGSAAWMSRPRRRYQIKEPFELSSLTVVGAYVIFGPVAFLATIVAMIIDQQGMSIPGSIGDILVFGSTFILYAVGIAACIGIFPAMLFEYLFCRTLLKRVNRGVAS
jgi:hypothetical protein